jgi:hypothetical protein
MRASPAISPATLPILLVMLLAFASAAVASGTEGGARGNAVFRLVHRRRNVRHLRAAARLLRRDSGAVAQRGMTDAAPVLEESAIQSRFNNAIYPLTQRDRHVSGIWGAIHAAGLKIVEGTKP